MNKLNLGCGVEYKEGWTNVDIIKDYKADIYFDLNKKFPLKSNTYDYVLMRMILEHLDDPIKALKEVIRVCKNNAVIEVWVSHGRSYADITDIQHKTAFTESSFEKCRLVEYGLKELTLQKVTFDFSYNKWKRFIPFKKYLKIFLNGIYDDIVFEFRVNKPVKTKEEIKQPIK